MSSFHWLAASLTVNVFKIQDSFIFPVGDFVLDKNKRLPHKDTQHITSYKHISLHTLITLDIDHFDLYKHGTLIYQCLKWRHQQRLPSCPPWAEKTSIKKQKLNHWIYYSSLYFSCCDTSKHLPWKGPICQTTMENILCLHLEDLQLFPLFLFL